MDCLFCAIISGAIPSTKLYEDDKMLVFKDINPQAPFHVLAIPKAHIASVGAVKPDDAPIVGYIFTKIAELAPSWPLENGFRVISNCGPDACQSVHHLHFHILGGAQLSDKMA